MGYTPLFDTLTKGTLCGRWPDIGLWPIVLSLSDRHGVVDATPTHIAAITGLSLDDVVACMKRFCEPDPYSRSTEHNGARLTLLDPHREWGWQIVNHGKYREKARKQAYDSERTASGMDAQRKRASRDVPTRPAPSRSPDGDEDLNEDRRKETRAGAREPPPEGLDFQTWERWKAYRSEIRKPIKPASMQAAQRKLAGYGADQAAVVEYTIAQGYTGLWEPKHNGNGKPKLGWRPPPDGEADAQ